MLAIDTNLLVRLIARDDEAQVRLAEDAVAGGAWISHLVLVECVWVLESVFDMSHEAIGTCVEMLLNHTSISVQESEVVLTALGQFRTHRGVDFSDCMLLEIARKAGHRPLATFDRQLGKLDGVQLLK